MTRREVFFFGAIGGILPILVSIFSIDLSPIIDHPGSLTLGNYIGFGLRVVALIIAGGVVALMNSSVRTQLRPMTLVQLGVTAPALLTSFINAGGPALRPLPSCPSPMRPSFRRSIASRSLKATYSRISAPGSAPVLIR